MILFLLIQDFLSVILTSASLQNLNYIQPFWYFHCSSEISSSSWHGAKIYSYIFLYASVYSSYVSLHSLASIIDFHSNFSGLWSFGSVRHCKLTASIWGNFRQTHLYLSLCKDSRHYFTIFPQFLLLMLPLVNMCCTRFMQNASNSKLYMQLLKMH